MNAKIQNKINFNRILLLLVGIFLMYILSFALETFQSVKLF